MQWQGREQSTNIEIGKRPFVQDKARKEGSAEDLRLRNNPTPNTGVNMTPGPTAQKNLPLSPAATDLGLGDSLQQQLQDQLAERRKRLQQPGGAIPGTSPFSSSVSDLLGQFIPGA